MRLSRARAVYYVNLVEEYERLHPQHTRFEVRHVIHWAATINRLEVNPQDLHRLACQECSQALRHERRGEGQHGIRRFHSLTLPQSETHPEERTLWGDLDGHVTPAFMQASLWQRRGAIETDVDALRRDVEGVNNWLAERNLPPITMSFNFDRPGTYGATDDLPE
jgi:hypothetical protein